MCSTGSITPKNKGGGVRPLMEDFHKKAAFFSMKASLSKKRDKTIGLVKNVT